MQTAFTLKGKVTVGINLRLRTGQPSATTLETLRSLLCIQAFPMCRCLSLMGIADCFEVREPWSMYPDIPSCSKFSMLAVAVSLRGCGCRKDSPVVVLTQHMLQAILYTSTAALPSPQCILWYQSPIVLRTLGAKLQPRMRMVSVGGPLNTIL